MYIHVEANVENSSSTGTYFLPIRIDVKSSQPLMHKAALFCIINNRERPRYTIRQCHTAVTYRVRCYAYVTTRHCVVSDGVPFPTRWTNENRASH